MSRLTVVHCSGRALSHLSLFFGLVACGALSLAVATDYWIFTVEVIDPTQYEAEAIEGIEPVPEDGSANATTDEAPGLIDDGLGDLDLEGLGVSGSPEEMLYGGMGGIPPTIDVKMHAGLWRACIYYDVSGAIRRSSPVIVFSLLLMMAGLTLSIVGTKNRDVKTLLAAVFYISSALCLAVGVIFYISAVNDEVSHRKKSQSAGSGDKGSGFVYSYGWAFFFAGSSFISAMVAAVYNISLYLQRFPNPSRPGPGHDGFSSASDDCQLIQPPGGAMGEGGRERKAWMADGERGRGREGEVGMGGEGKDKTRNNKITDVQPEQHTQQRQNKQQQQQQQQQHTAEYNSISYFKDLTSISSSHEDNIGDHSQDSFGRKRQQQQDTTRQQSTTSQSFSLQYTSDFDLTLDDPATPSVEQLYEVLPERIQRATGGDGTVAAVPALDERGWGRKPSSGVITPV